MIDERVNHARSSTDASNVESKPSRPNYSQIHAKAFPLETYPLPAFIPHNPLSALRIIYLVLSQFFFPPVSHPPVLHKASFSSSTRSVNVTDPVAIRALWENGFFGKGTLSRSEPTWLEREKRRRGFEMMETAEEVTNRRREERREMKKERARKERELVEEQLKKEGKVAIDIGITLDDPDAAKADFDKGSPELQEKLELEAELIKDQEHLQLSYEEAFFLTYGLGILEIYSEETHDRISNLDLLKLFRQHSYFPTRSSTLQPDDPFLLSYIVYHHFRSLGWVVREGLKFAVDFLLYNRGPVFAHAQFAIVIIPAYQHPYWSETPERAAVTRKKARKSWWWLHAVNRVQATVRKDLVLAYVEIPPPGERDGEVAADVEDIGKLLKSYKVREFAVKRWTPNRNRD
ncbi:hypothetical protein EV356DRAFT_524984 [Viridothelium virens]|uniref:tRNA-splicing endonuclease subunit Sen2 n=1 Tax=Viridothelium virens TaxID=1048519 RepID=A0A6A6H4N4_VIRVR|nr:hypothetical protein EV356DRAFT_524984 [Viridothelium virens]